MSLSPPFQFDLVVCGATAPGIIAAVRAAREGLRVALVASGPKLGGGAAFVGRRRNALPG